MSTLPRFVVLKSAYNGKYLSKISNEESTKKGLPTTFLKFHGEEIASPYTKFQVERVKKNLKFVHLRCCHNNKYLVWGLAGKSSSRPLWIVAADMDRSLWNLLEPAQTHEDRF
ncbi:hypothetical protein L484_023704 [Morus notabilis]|uniref:Agglutinin domain-containing protein n=1 Tax=Morus notabilis TaxID=981085 RepID=W9RCQ2_9ROSA|nr:hypothetical protein L484_023704 [Morus notabilis]